MDILSVTGTVLFTSALNLLRDAVIEAVKKRANLSGANLYRANLSEADLYRADLSEANLYRADLSGANLYRANLYRASLSEANLYRANLYEANLSEANLYRANLSGANLSGANLYEADLYRADLSEAKLSGANLYRANLSEANLYEAKNAELAIARQQFIPEEGSFVGWKKCRDGVIVKLWIGKTAKRSHGTERKCRASRVKVAEIFGGEFGVSLHDDAVIYRIGEIVEPNNGWDDNRWNTCAPGIHFYITRAEAENHQ